MPDGVLGMPAAVASQVQPAVDWMFGCSDAAHASGLILTTDSINRESGRHMRRIGLYSSLLASRLGWSGDEAARLQQAAALPAWLPVPGAALRQRAQLQQPGSG